MSLTAENVHERALRYLQRYASSSENLRRVLLRGLKRRQMKFHDVPPEAPQWVDASVEKCLKLRLVDDVLYAESKVASLRRQGRSSFYIARHLQQKGVPQKLIAEQMPSDTDADLAAAKRFVKKKRLGRDKNPDTQKKDLAKLLRAGFPFGIAKQALNASVDEEDFV